MYHTFFHIFDLLQYSETCLIQCALGEQFCLGINYYKAISVNKVQKNIQKVSWE